MNEDALPRSKEFDNKREAKSVAATPATITAVRIRDEPSADAAKNMVIMLIIAGNLPLHGTRLFVIIAIRRSRGLSIIRQPVTPTAVQPNP